MLEMKMTVWVDMDKVIDYWEDGGWTSSRVGCRFAAREYLQKDKGLAYPTCALMNELGDILQKELERRGADR